MMMKAEIGVMWGYKPRKAGSLQKLEKAKKQSLFQSFQKECGPADSLWTFWLPEL